MYHLSERRSVQSFRLNSLDCHEWVVVANYNTLLCNAHPGFVMKHLDYQIKSLEMHLYILYLFYYIVFYMTHGFYDWLLIYIRACYFFVTYVFLTLRKHIEADIKTFHSPLIYMYICCQNHCSASLSMFIFIYYTSKCECLSLLLKNKNYIYT